MSDSGERDQLVTAVLSMRVLGSVGGPAGEGVTSCEDQEEDFLSSVPTRPAEGEERLSGSQPQHSPSHGHPLPSHLTWD